jgi:hypothetical protein
MNSMMHNVSEFKGFNIAKPIPPRCQFLRNILQGVEMISAGENVTALRVPRLTLAAADSRAVNDSLDWIAEQEGALSRFESEGGMLGRLAGQ